MLYSVGWQGLLWGEVAGLQRQGPFDLQTGYVTYFPRISFPIMEGAAISAGVPLSIGIGTMNNALFDAKGKTLSYDIPIVIDYNNGFKSGPPGDDLFGFYFGSDLAIQPLILTALVSPRHVLKM
jgi:hypothetical protein